MSRVVGDRYALSSCREVANDDRAAAVDADAARLFIEGDRVEVQAAVLEVPDASAKTDQLPVPLQDLAMLSSLALIPVEPGSLERIRRLRVGNLRRIGDERCEFRLAPFADRPCQRLILKIREILKRTRSIPLFALKEHGTERRGHEHRRA